MRPLYKRVKQEGDSRTEAVVSFAFFPGTNKSWYSSDFNLSFPWFNNCQILLRLDMWSFKVTWWNHHIKVKRLFYENSPKADGVSV